MKPMIRRLRLLEEAWQVVIEVEREDSPAAIIRARRLRRLQMEDGCVPTETMPRRSFPPGATLADILRQCRPGARCEVAQ
jgi:hypothetical protein